VRRIANERDTALNPRVGEDLLDGRKIDRVGVLKFAKDMDGAHGVEQLRQGAPMKDDS
jgi:hypothetical protein